MSDRDKISRRRTLRAVATTGGVAGFSSIGVIGTSEAEGEPNPPGEGPGEPISGSAAAEMELTKANGLSEKQFDAYVKKQRNRYGDDLVGSIKPPLEDDRSDSIRDDVSAQSSAPETKNLSFVRAWPAQSYDVVANQTNALLARADHSLALYRSPTTDPDGKNVYYFWHWSQSNAESKWWYTGRTTFMRNRIRLQDSREELTNFAPNQALTVDGRTYPITLSAVIRNLPVSIGSSFTLRKGQVFPESGQIQLGSAGRFSVAFKGCARNIVVGMNGVTEVRSPRTFSSGAITWDTRVDANSTCVFG